MISRLRQVGGMVYGRFRRIFLAVWRGVGRLAQAARNVWLWFIWEPLLFILLPPWRLLGRMGLALRHLLTRFVWRPFTAVSHTVWHWWGQTGLAARYGLTWVLWKPFLLLVVRPLKWSYWRIIRPFFLTLLRLFRALLARLRAAGQARWQAGAPGRALRRRRLRSWWQVRRAKWRTRFLRRRPPKTAVFAPAVPLPQASARSHRLQLSTAFLGATALLVASFVVQQQNRQLQAQGPRNLFSLPRLTISRVELPAVTPAPTVIAPTPSPTPWPLPDPLDGGGSVAFSWHQNGNSDIYILAVGQSDPIRLTSHPAPDQEPAWSPNGQELAFASRRDGNWDVYVYDLAQAELRRVTASPAYDGRPHWSPDGQWLVYESYQDENLDIYIIKADLSAGPYRLTHDPALDFDPVWSPGGRHVAFTSWRGGNQDIFLMSLDAASDELAVNLTQSPNRQEDQPAFAPNGRYLAYHETGSDFDLVYALPLTADYTPAAAAVSIGQQGQYPAWSPGGDALFYVYDQNGRSHLVAGSPDAFGVTPQAFTVNGRLQFPDWTAVTLTPNLAGHLFNVNQVSSIDPIMSDQPLYVENLTPPEQPEENNQQSTVNNQQSTENAQSPISNPQSPPYLLHELPINAPAPYLSDRVDDSFMALRERVTAEVGWDFLGQLDNMFVAIEDKPLLGLSGPNWNQAGRAFDLPYRDALAFEPRVEIVREEVGVQTFWRVFVRAEVQDGRFGQPLRQLPWDFRARYDDDPQYYDDGGKLKETIPAGYYVDFTALAADYGWQRVPAAENWRAFFPGILFWHYQNQQGLTWEAALQEIYAEAEITAVIPTP